MTLAILFSSVMEYFQVYLSNIFYAKNKLKLQIVWLVCAVMENDCERCKRTYECLQSMVQGARPNDMACIGSCCSSWANPIGAQWKEINKLVDKGMIKSRGVPNANISKGRLELF